jgi:hypothetical protein
VLRLVLLLVLLLLLIRFAYLLARRVQQVLRAGTAAPAPPASVPLVACASCGVMVPQPRALPQGAGAYLCRSCAQR